ncbi:MULTISPECIES: ChrR family anti-sigma-E factor [Nitrincola]|uniref:Transcriptional activator ChrR n=1 Tax=Nitrincola nitratireducens TaxID=1229521 RepID=W9VRM7_9GAMM|nr:MULTISPECIES: ChrR family anti-sigma-E factor [Nitrincola]EXJ13070.1 Transcriptional activator ChrR [Nitrincola nitratireducens]
MNISHHFDDATLMAYASGSLPQGMALLVACHLHWCPHCRQRLAEAEAIGGALLAQIEPMSLKADALKSVMDRLDLEEEIPLPQIRPVQTATDLPAPLHHYLQTNLDHLPWKRLGYGVHHIDLNLKGPGATRLLKIAPGVSVPHHTHAGNELTLILRGSYTDEFGRFSAGDVADLDGEVKHQPIVDTDQDCICLIATDAPLKFTGLMGRLVQPFIGL